MKKFITCWLAVVLVGVTLPSLFVALGMVTFYGAGDAPTAHSKLDFGIGMFMLMSYTIYDNFFWPAVAVLLIAVAFFAGKSLRSFRA